MPDSQPDVSELAREVVDELEDTRQIGDQLLLSRREAIALSTGAVSLGALGVAGAGTASAEEAAGQIGSDSERVNIFANELDVNNLTLDEAIELVDGDVDFGGNDANSIGALEAGSVSTGSVSTEEATIDGQKADLNHEFIGEDSNTTAQKLEVEEPFADFDVVWLYYAVDSRSEDRLDLVLDGNTDGDYSYFDQSGSPNANQDGFLLADIGGSGFVGVCGVITIMRNSPGFDQRGINHRLGFRDDHIGDINSFGREGGYASFESKMEITGIGTDNGNSTVRVYGRREL